MSTAEVTAFRAGASVPPDDARDAARQVLRDWRGRQGIAVFGAGAHTQKILPVLVEFTHLIESVADDSPARWGDRIGPWVVRSPRDAISNRVGGILVSSDVQQESLAAALRARFADRRAILTLYPPPDPDDGPALPFTGERQTGRTLDEIELGHRARYYWALQHLPDGAAVLDAACGNGYGCAILAGGGARVLGVDVSQHAVEFARHHYASARTRFAVAIVDDGASLQPLAAQFAPVDVVTSFETLEHLEHPAKFLGTAAELLRPGGQLFCSTPNPATMALEEAPFHRQHFEKGQLLDLLSNSGFELDGWYGQEGMQLLLNRSTRAQRYQLFRAVRRC